MKINFRDISLLYSSSIINLISLIFIQFIFAKGFSVEDFGLFSSVIALLVIFIPIVNFGVSPFIIKNSYYKILKNEEVLLLIISILILSLITSLFIFFTLINFYQINFFLTFLFLIHFISLITYELSISFFQSRILYKNIFKISIFFNFFRLLFLLIIFLNFTNYFNLKNILLLYSFISLILIIYSYKLISSFYTIKDLLLFIKLNDDKFKIFKKIINNLKDFGLLGFFFYLYYFFDIILIKFFVNDEAAGIFSLSLSLLFFFYFFPTIIIDKYFQNYFYKFYIEKNFISLRLLFKNLFYLFIILSLIIYFIFFHISNHFIFFIFQDKFSNLINIFNILLVSILFRFLSILCIAILYTSERVSKVYIFWGIITFLKIISSIFILNFYNTIILSYSFVFFEICLFLLSFILTTKYIYYEKI